MFAFTQPVYFVDLHATIFTYTSGNCCRGTEEATFSFISSHFMCLITSGWGVIAVTLVNK
jgi:hypothetical protein